jgi:uncharacterized membrane protein YjgN (DUF898 family)
MADDGSLLSRNLGRRKLISYQGSIGGLYRIYIPNLLLTIVTLGIWRFWGVTRMRRYVWGLPKWTATVLNLSTAEPWSLYLITTMFIDMAGTTMLACPRVNNTGAP